MQRRRSTEAARFIAIETAVVTGTRVTPHLFFSFMTLPGRYLF
jgi:hypothetical protein